MIPNQVPAQSDQPPVQYVVYQRPKPRIAQGLGLLLLAGVSGLTVAGAFALATGVYGPSGVLLSAIASTIVSLVIFVMGQTMYGALWRSWVVAAIIAAVLTLLQ